jgi:hypothetical protein
MSLPPGFEHLHSKALRDRADEARVIAQTFKDAQTRGQMLRIAMGYDRMARQMEKHETGDDRPDAR